MNTKIGRFLIFIMKENTRKIFAFIVYVYFIGIFMKIDLPLVLKIISFIVLFGCNFIIFIILKIKKKP